MAGQALSVQPVDGKLLVEVTVPSRGWTTVCLDEAVTAPQEAPAVGAVRADERSLENECLRMEFNAQGEISSLFDKESGLELAAGPCNSFRMNNDVPNWFNAWDIDSLYGRSITWPVVQLPLATWLMLG